MTSSSVAFQLGASSSSSPPSPPSFHPWNHDVFLSFRGKDVRPNFISHLYQALDQRGINTYIDMNLERVEKISSELFKAIEDPTEVRHQKGNFGKSFDKVGDKLKDNENMLKWKKALKRVANLSGFQLAKFRDEAEFIQTIVGEVDSRILEKTPLSVAKYPIGIKSRIQDIYYHLSNGRNDIIRVIGIYGLVGLGPNKVEGMLLDLPEGDHDEIYILTSGSIWTYHKIKGFCNS